LAKAKAKAAVKRKPVKAPARAAAATKSAAPKPAKASVAKTKAVKTAATKTSVAKVAVAKAAAAKTAVAKPAVTKVTIAKADADKAPLEKTAAATRTNDVKVAAAPVVASAPRSTQQLTLPAAKAAEAPAVKPQPIVRKLTDAQRADLPPPDGFTLLVDGHFKNSFDDLKGAKAAASELKGRFPMLRVEIYDAAKKARLPA
jgi:hypothetical protein